MISKDKLELKTKTTNGIGKFIFEILLFFILLFQYAVCFSAEQERFLHFTEVDGLPRNIITCLEMDQYGYLWIGTPSGIARYDGKNFQIYHELSGTGVISLLFDSKQTLWVSTGIGLYKYNRLTNFFELVAAGYITKIMEYKGNIYFLEMSSVYKIEGQKTAIVLEGKDMSDFCYTDDGLWYSTNQGVFLSKIENGAVKTVATYLKDQSVFKLYKIDNQLFVSLYNGQLYDILSDRTLKFIDTSNHYFIHKIIKIGNEYWASTDGNGILILNKELKVSRILDRIGNSFQGINSNSIYDILQGKNQEIWLASYGAGLTCILPDNLLFKNILPEKGNENSLVATEGVSVFIKNNNIYFGTNYGLSTWNETTGNFKNLSSDILRKDLNGTKVTALEVDQNNDIWVGTYDGLLGKYSSDYHLLEKYHPSSDKPDEMQQIVQLKRVCDKNLLILTQSHNRILVNFDLEKNKFSTFELFSKGSNITYCLLNTLRYNQKGELLALISDHGLFHVNWKDNVLENRLTEINKIVGSYISDFYQDKKGLYWFATSTNGLVCISEDGKIYKKYTIKEGLPSNTLVRIESSGDKYLWISTISGICRFDTETGQSLSFNNRDGLPANEFLERVSGKTDDGKIIFGSSAGFTIIDPSKVIPETIGAEVVISDITFQNQSIRSSSGKKYLKIPLEDTREIKLPYNKNSFSIYFFTKNRISSKYLNYAYRLIGLEKDWTFHGETNFATYTNLSPGKYTFEIKSTENTQKVRITQLLIHILPPWYLCWYALIAYFIIFSVIIYLSFYAFMKRIELKKEKEYAKLKIVHEQELTEKKLAFFTNISHDLKTPLTLISAPVNDLLHSDNLTTEQLYKLKTINRNSKRLYKLISDLLDFRKITLKQHSLEISETRISDLLSEIIDAFTEECNNKSIRLVYSPLDSFCCYVDAKKIEKIVWNLLSNALKFTDNGGTIEVSVEEKIIEGFKYLFLAISDNGIGISDSDQRKIFDKFFKVHDSLTNGTGIGLSIVKELVDLHHGKIEVNSVLGSGTTFKILLPADLKLFDEDEIVAVTDNFKSDFIPEKELISEKNLIPDNPANSDDLQQLLIVEDNSELREYLAVHFEKVYNVIQAKDGQEGLDLAIKSNPDIILTDIYMPNMNGYEFCKNIRNNFDTSHIPIVMLTASNTIENQIEGLATGADAYLTKPFEIKLLDTLLYSLLENRKKLRIKFIGLETPENLYQSLTPGDIQFVMELKLFIEENILNQDLNIELLSEHFAISVSQLYRKIKSLMGSTPNNLIKSIRLKKAYSLISENGVRVSEAAYLSGFNDPNYFATCFKKEFGKKPSQIGTGMKIKPNSLDID
jgi:signal transduction histidine kinase/DNA-binding response OmpR family regulator/ligand-binding sensor domain-containing protein